MSSTVFSLVLAPLLWTSCALALMGPLALLRAFVPPGEGAPLVEAIASVWSIAAAIAARVAVWQVWKRVRERSEVPPR